MDIAVDRTSFIRYVFIAMMSVDAKDDKKNKKIK
jgi:hypothetical protein